MRAQRLAQVAAGNYAAPSQASLADYLEAWFESRRDRLANYTLERYRTLARIQVSPRIGKVSLTTLTGATLAALYADLAREGGKNGGPLSPTTCRRVHSMLHAALSAACRQRLLALNPADHVEPPRARKGTMHFLEPTDLARLLAGTAARPDLRRLYVPALLGGVLGLRRGEALACRWADLSFEIGELLVARSLEAIRSPQPGSGTASRSLSFKIPKSGRACRVAVPRFVLDALATPGRAGQGPACARPRGTRTTT